MSLFHTVPSGVPLNVVAISVASRHLTIVWLPPAMDQHNGIIRYYTVDITTKEEGGRAVQINTNDTSAFIENLHPFYVYSFSVLAVTVGPGPLSAGLEVQLLQEGVFFKI